MLTKEMLRKYKNNIPLFVEEQLVDDNGKQVTVFPYQAAFMENAFSRNSDGKLKYRTAVFSHPRKDGKSYIAAMIAVHGLFTKTNQRIPIIAAAGKEQGRIIFKKVKNFVEKNRSLASMVKIRQWDIEVPVLDNQVKVVPADSTSALGWEDDIIIFDELGHLRKVDYDVYYNITTGQGSLIGQGKDAILIVVSTVGNDDDKDHPFRKLYEAGLNEPEKNPEVYFQYSTKNLNPFITEEYLAQEKKRLPRQHYTKLYQNTYASSINTPITMDHLLACEDIGRAPLVGSPSYTIYLGLDLGLRKDKAVLSAVEMLDDSLVLHELKYWEPEELEKGVKEVNLQKVFDTVKDKLHKGYPNFKKFIADRWQFMMGFQTLRSRFGPDLIEEKQISTQSKQQIYQNFFRLILSRKLRLYDFRYDTMQLFIKQCLGIELMDDKYTHSSEGDDLVFACALAAWRAVQDYDGIIDMDNVDYTLDYKEDSRGSKGNKELRELLDTPDWQEMEIDYIGNKIDRNGEYTSDTFYKEIGRV